MSIYTKLLEIQSMHLSFEKDANNPFFKSKYVSLDSIVEKLTPILDDKKLLVLHYTKDKEVITEIVDVEKDPTYSIYSRFPLIDSNDPQKLGSCITYAKRYNLGQIFNIITDRDDDGNEASGNIEQKIKEEVKQEKKQEVNNYGKCRDCGADNVLNPKTGKIFCSAKCFLPKKVEPQQDLSEMPF